MNYFQLSIFQKFLVADINAVLAINVGFAINVVVIFKLFIFVRRPYVHVLDHSIHLILILILIEHRNEDEGLKLPLELGQSWKIRHQYKHTVVDH
jgi:hypothetical protein